MFKKYIKNTLIALLLLSYATTTFPMEHSNKALASDEVAVVENDETQIEAPIEEEYVLTPEERKQWLKDTEEREAREAEAKAEEEDAKDSWASLSWWTKGLNIFNTLNGSYYLLKHWCAPYSYAKKGFLPIGQFIQNGQYPAVIKTLKTVQQAMPISQNTYINIDKKLGMAGAASRNLIHINPDLLMLHDEDERATIIGHESRHVYHNDLFVEDLRRIACPFVTYGILKAYSKGVRYLLTALQQKTEKGSKLYRYLRTAKKVNTAISHNVITHFFLEMYLSEKYKTFYELRADRESALLLNNIEAGISSINKLKDPEFINRHAKIVGCDAAEFAKNIAENDAVSPYPIAMRLKAYEALKK